MSLVYIGLAFIVPLCFLIFEKYQLTKQIKSIRYRIHINGTRGKTSVSRLIAAGLRAGGLHTISKTSGSDACIIFNDGTEQVLPRGPQANIIEQSKIIKEAAKRSADALVIECMALRPDLQAFCELNFIKSTHSVITNAGPDHFDVMGPTVKDVALALAGTTPRKATLFTNEKKLRWIFADSCKDRKSELAPVPDADKITPEDMEGFTYIEHPENVALALQVCTAIGVDKKTALKGMYKSKVDIGAMTIHSIQLYLNKVVFVNGFGANDPESTQKCWELVNHRFATAHTKVMIVCCRDDRQERSVQMAEMCLKIKHVHKFVLIGTGIPFFMSVVNDNEEFKANLINCTEETPGDIVDLFARKEAGQVLMMGVGNIKGAGMDLLHYFIEIEKKTVKQSIHGQQYK